MKIDFKEPKYVLPLILLPFMFLLNYGLQSFSKEDGLINDQRRAEIQEGIGDVSEQIRNRGIDGKLDAFRSRYKSADGYTAINNLRIEVDDGAVVETQYNEAEKRMLDSIDNALKNSVNPKPSSQRVNQTMPPRQYDNFQSTTTMSKEDEELLKAIEQLQGSGQGRGAQAKYDDPMELFRAQMEVIDSISKANDPDYQQLEMEEEPEKEVIEQPKKRVKKADTYHELFNTVSKSENNAFIKAIVDEDIQKGGLGERLRIRLLEDIEVGGTILKKGTYLYALISGYEAQRVKLSINSVMVEDKIHPINLSIYDNDGMEGLYVPVSSFREFSKELGENATGGMNIQMQQNPSSINQFYMSTLQKLFTSTSQAMSKRIRQNAANLKYGTFIYLIDPEELGENQLSNSENFN